MINFPSDFEQNTTSYIQRFENSDMLQKFGQYLKNKGLIDNNPNEYHGMKVSFELDRSSSIKRLYDYILEINLRRTTQNSSNHVARSSQGKNTLNMPC